MGRKKEKGSGIKKYYYTFSLKVDHPDVDHKMIQNKIYQYYKSFYILHDKDINKETGEVKDPHYHYWVEFKNPRSLNSVAKELNIKSNMLLIVENKRAMLEYFIHANNPDKAQYSVDDVVSNGADYKKEILYKTKRDILQEWDDYVAVMEGRLHPRDYLYKYQYILCDITNYSRK
ncbi:replication protein [Candidatus Saccharibacteria bacterium]|nr:replication protein [Candidatus Saccharibacteria bacterium]